MLNVRGRNGMEEVHLKKGSGYVQKEAKRIRFCPERGQKDHSSAELASLRRFLKYV